MAKSKTTQEFIEIKEVRDGVVVLKDGTQISQDKMQEELIAIIRKNIGAVACFKQAGIVKRLPKTRSGKILRKNNSETSQ